MNDEDWAELDQLAMSRIFLHLARVSSSQSWTENSEDLWKKLGNT